MPSKKKVKARQEARKAQADRSSSPGKQQQQPVQQSTTNSIDNAQNNIKTIYLIRHGESQGQVARENGLDRKRDTSLIDCGLTKRGIRQAHAIPSFFGVGESEAELVISSPLTRALQTATLGFPDQNILIHYGLREIGHNPLSPIPENLPRRGGIEAVLDYIQQNHYVTPTVDDQTLRPATWPPSSRQQQHGDDQIHGIFQWMAQERTERTIAVVCHHNVIQKALAGFRTRPQNAAPIPCHLYPDGKLVPI